MIAAVATRRRKVDLVETLALFVLGLVLLVYAWVFALIPAILLVRRPARVSKVGGWLLVVLVGAVAILIVTIHPPL